MRENTPRIKVASHALNGYTHSKTLSLALFFFQKSNKERKKKHNQKLCFYSSLAAMCSYIKISINTISTIESAMCSYINKY